MSEHKDGLAKWIAEEEMATTVTRAKMVYPFPLRPDVIAEVRVPTDLTLAEAERIGKFVLTLAVDADEESEDV